MIMRVPKILLPHDNFDYSKWAVVACDQFTSQPRYWKQLESLVESEISTLHLIFPEVYLENNDRQERTTKINNAMKAYIKQGIFKEVESLIMVDRTLKNGKHRLGIMLEIDLEDYDYSPQNQALIKATEKTVVDRLPPRIDIRKGAYLEIPHIMLLMDDPDVKIIEKLYSNRDDMLKLYDFDLNMDGGHIVGYEIPNSQKVLQDLQNYASKRNQISQDSNAIMFVVGDGNHSLATAKECWKLIKSTLTEEQQLNNPARYALCELVNLQDSSLEFQPIHRVIKNADKCFIKYLQSELKGDCSTKAVFEDIEYPISISSSQSDAIADLQDAMDRYTNKNPHIVVDYIHGDDYLLEVAKEQKAVALFMPTLTKDTLFDYCARRGVLPRKSFSMGFAEDKRYYLEAKAIK